MKRGTIRIGTSGWHYAHWVGPFYPDGTTSDAFLEFYARRFATVEVNNTFYQLPSENTLATWRDGTPADFLFSFKASRYITHMKKLKEPAQSTRAFFRVLDGLGEKLGPVLFQLPPRWHADPGRLDAFLTALPDGFRFVFELRDETWFRAAVYDVLSRHNAALCIYDLEGYRSPPKLTADFTYVRLHGPDGAYRGSYDGRALSGWARRLKAWAEDGIDVYCYFDNDERGYAALDARRLQEMVQR